jgi:hypothetical protein
MCEQYVRRARERLDLDDPSLEDVQSMMLLAMAYFSMGDSKKCWMQVGSAIRSLQQLAPTASYHPAWKQAP